MEKTQTIDLTNFQIHVLVGLLLGNGSLQTFSNGKTYRFRFIQSEKRKNYVFHVYEVLQDFVKTPPKLLIESRKDGVQYNKWYFNTLTFSSFKFFADLFYVNGNKKVDPKIIDWLSPVTLAYWFMDNGAQLYKNKKGFRFCTEGFKKEEVLFLQKVLLERFGLKSSLRAHRLGFRLVILPESHDDFVALIKDHVFVDFQFLLKK